VDSLRTSIACTAIAARVQWSLVLDSATHALDRDWRQTNRRMYRLPLWLELNNHVNVYRRQYFGIR